MRVAHMPAGKAAVVAESLRKSYNSVDDDVEVRLGGDKKIQDESGIFLRSRRGIDDRKPYYAFITFERRSTDETINKIHNCQMQTCISRNLFVIIVIIRKYSFCSNDGCISKFIGRMRND